MSLQEITQRRRGVPSVFREAGRSKLSVKFNDEEMTWINHAAAHQSVSLAEIIRRSVRESMSDKTSVFERCMNK